MLEQNRAERIVIDKPEYRRSVGICVINNEGKVFSARYAFGAYTDQGSSPSSQAGRRHAQHVADASGRHRPTGKPHGCSSA